MREGRAVKTDAARFNWKKWRSRLVLLLFLVLTFVVRCHNRGQIFHHGGVYFVDGDCYSRMTRAKSVLEGHWIIRKHDFENWPQGIIPHTTAPMDWLIAGLKPVVEVVFKIADPRGASVLKRQALDVAGALVSPLLGMAVAAWLWWWAGRMRLPYRTAMLLLFALSPIAVHGTVLGRPDHQSLLLFLLAVALGCELRLVHSADDDRIVRRAWSIAAGSAWGIALWVSLYEPLVLFLAVMLMRVVNDRANLLARGRRSGWLALIGFVALGLIVDGWRVAWPDPALRENFARWSSTIGELRHLSLAGPLLWEWLGLLALVCPVLLWRAGREDRRAVGVLAALLLLLGFTIWQMRWGYFLLLAFAMSLPWQLRAFRNPWIAWPAMLLAMWPLGSSWWRTLRPTDSMREDQAWRQLSHARLRAIADKMRAEPGGGFLAPWWTSPQLAYWSGQPGVAGSSHESLPGTLDVARFLLTTDPLKAAEILRRRQVGWVVADNASFDVVQRDQLLAVTSSASLLAQRIPEEPFAVTLAMHPSEVPDYLREITPAELGLVRELQPKDGGSPESRGIKVYATQMHRLYRVESNLP